MFDSPVFKVLSRNDTGAASGHQGGLVIPKELEEYFPPLKGRITPASPTVEQLIEAELLLDGVYKGSVTTRYQFQTWGGARSPERRLTSSLGSIRNYADKDDILLFQRSLEDPLKFRMSLITRASPEYPELIELIGSSRWGVLRPEFRPVENDAVAGRVRALKAAETKQVELFLDRKAAISTVERKVRNVAFRHRLVEIYEGRCAVSGRSLQKPTGGSGLDAAHIIPVEAGGSDDPRNGILLSKDVHWAFDSGLVYIGPDRVTVVPEAVRSIPSNQFLRSLAGIKLADPNPDTLRPDMAAIEWHRRYAIEKLAVAAR